MPEKGLKTAMRHRRTPEHGEHCEHCEQANIGISLLGL